MTDEPVVERKGPKKHHYLVLGLTVVLGVLLYWFLGFLVDDISDRPGPDLTVIQKKYQDPAVVKEKEQFEKSMADLSGNITAQQQQQTILQTSINSYRDTMNQLLDLQKASIQKGVSFSEDSQKNLQELTALYLSSQQHFQEVNASITKNNLAVEQLRNKIKADEEKLSAQNKEAYKEYQSAWEKHNWAMAGLQLLVLIPLLLLSVYLYRRHRQSLYRSMFLAASIAVFVKIALVMQMYFPSYIFKYLFVLALIYITVLTLINQLRCQSRPKPDWLQKQYREGYQKNQCPVCEFGIKPGVTKFMSAEEAQGDTRYLEKVEAYTCPSCGEQLFEQCGQCKELRHSLLHYCDHCGNKKDFS